MNTNTSGQNAGYTHFLSTARTIPESDAGYEQKGKRYNEGKPMLQLIDLNCMEDCARALEFGLSKYGENNWQLGFPISSILGSLLRHIAAIQRGEDIDPESGVSHIGHIQANAMFLGSGKNW